MAHSVQAGNGPIYLSTTCAAVPAYLAFRMPRLQACSLWDRGDFCCAAVPAHVSPVVPAPADPDSEAASRRGGGDKVKKPGLEQRPG